MFWCTINKLYRYIQALTVRSKLYRNLALTVFLCIVVGCHQLQSSQVSEYGEPWYQRGVAREVFLEQDVLPALGTRPDFLEAVQPIQSEANQEYSFINPLGEKVPLTILGLPEGGLPQRDAHPTGAASFEHEQTQNIAQKPLVIALHQTNETGRREACRNDQALDDMAYGNYFAAQGYIVVCPTLSFTGERQPTNHWDTTQFYEQFSDWSALGKDVQEVSWLIDALAATGFDLDDLCVLGHSQGAIYTLFAAALDERIQYAIANAGYVSFEEDPEPTRWSRDHWFKALPAIPTEFVFSEVVAAISPRPALIINYLNDTILFATGPDEAIESMADYVPAIDWVFASGEHGWPIETKSLAASWLVDQYR